MDKATEDHVEVPNSNVHKVAPEGVSELCCELLERGGEVDERDDLGWTPLMHAAHNGQGDLVEKLLASGADPCLSNHHGVTAFTLSVLRCKRSVLGRLYKELTPELRQTESNYGLEVACVRGLVPVVKWLLLNTCAQVNHVSSFTGMTPLHLAIIEHHCELVGVLLRHGADILILSDLGQDGLEMARLVKDRKILYLLQHDLSPTQDICFDLRKPEKTASEAIDPLYTLNRIFLNINGDIVLKNSPNRPVFNTDQDNNIDLKLNMEMRLLESPSMRSVFLPRWMNGSPESPVLRNRDNYFDPSDDDEMKLLESSSLKGEFYPTPEPCSTPISQSASATSPRHHTPLSTLKLSTTPKRAKKRKLPNTTGCTSWLKRFTKRRSNSLEDSGGYVDLDPLRSSGIDFWQLLYELGLDEYYPIFKIQELDIWTFLTLSKGDLEAMGIHEKSSQEKILKGVETLRKMHL